MVNDRESARRAIWIIAGIIIGLSVAWIIRLVSMTNASTRDPRQHELVARMVAVTHSGYEDHGPVVTDLIRSEVIPYFEMAFCGLSNKERQARLTHALTLAKPMMDTDQHHTMAHYSRLWTLQ